MDPRVIALHDEALRLQPDDASHDGSLCPICVDWSLDVTGLPTGYERLDDAQKSAPYGDVEYADPGLLEDGVKRFPLDTDVHIEAVAKFLDREEVSDLYSPDDLKQVRQRAQSAAQRIGAKSQEAASEQSSQDEEGGSTPVADNEKTIAQETHEALLRKAVDDATEEARAEIAQLKEKVSDLSTTVETAEARVTELEQAHESTSAELDQAQVQLKTVTEENEQLKEDIASRDAEAEIAKVADERAEQVRNLGLFQEDYIKDKARVWAQVSEDDWSSRIEEWQQAKGDVVTTAAPQEQASAMSGASPAPKGGEKKSNRRAVLGLDD